MAVDFCDYFWGEEHNGWNVLYQNMKHGHNASKEFAEFFKERWSIDEAYCKSLAKLANKAGSNNDKGTLTPIFALLKASLEMMSSVHFHMVNKVQELVKEVSKYNDELHKKHKGVKDEESQTEEVVKNIQVTSNLALKARENYSQKCQELEKIKRDGASPKDVEKAEAKLRKAHDDYRSLVDKYNNIRDDFEKKMTLSCKKFQNVEESHLSHVLQFVQTYIDVIQNDHKAMGQIHNDLVNKYSQFTIDKLLDAFALNKYTGLEKPVMMVFEDTSSLGSAISGQQSPEPADQSKSSAEDASSTGEKASTAGGRSGGFLRSRRVGKKDKKVKKKKDAESPSNKEDKSDNENSEEAKTADLISVAGSLSTKDDFDSTANSEKCTSLAAATIDISKDSTIESMGDKSMDDSRGSFIADKSEDHSLKIDEEGYTIPPQLNKSHNRENSFDSSSESDSEIGIEKKIHVEIKPISNGTGPPSASIDEIKATIEGMSFSPISHTLTRRTPDHNENPPVQRSNSITNQISSSSATDLLGLNLHFTNNNNNLSPSKNISGGKELSQDRSAGELGEILGDTNTDSSSVPPILPPRGSSGSRGSTPTPTIAVPRPSSRKMLDSGNSRGAQSPATSNSILSRTESISSLEFRTSGMPTGISRGPSPLTIGMSDTIPLAVAFQELCHAYFRGTDESRVQMKVTGEMMVSFPAGIVGVLANNPAPAQLSFKVHNFDHLSNPLPNKQLVAFDDSQSSENCGSYNFNMSALSTLLRKQAEQNPTASYFNVDIIKYQVSNAAGVDCTPLQLVSYWRCEDTHTDLRIDYSYNSSAMSQAMSLLNIVISVPVDGIVRNMHSKPHGQWLKDQQKAVWKITELSQNSAGGGKGSLRGKFEVAAGPSTPTTVSAQFNCEGTTISGLEFSLLGSGYRVSLVKKRFVSGKYICDADAVLKLRYGAMPS